MRRAIITAIITIAVLLTPFAATANAAQPTTDRSIATVAFATSANLPRVFPTVNFHWWGVSFHYSKTATKMIAAGVAAAVTFPISEIAAVAVGAGVASWASDAIDMGNCLKVDVHWTDLARYPGNPQFAFRPGIEGC